MAETGTVTATAGLNLRAGPGGRRIGALRHGEKVRVLGRDGQWLRIRAGRRRGYVYARYVALAKAPEGEFRFDGENAAAPDGSVFARRYRRGVYNRGRTTVDQFAAAHGDLLADSSASALRVLGAVSANEGRLEAVNTWDAAFLSFGCLQWSAGQGSAKGELAALLERLKREEPAAFGRHFAVHGLDVAEVRGRLAYGRIVLAGEVLRTPAEKEQLRSLTWAWRFGRAGADPAVGRVQLRHAMARIEIFRRPPLSAYVTSEYGVALLLDQHVNHPRHLARTLRQAVEDLGGGLDATAPEAWGFAEEARLLERYLERRQQTSMTDSAGRAGRILAAVLDGRISDQRGSFVA